MMNTQPEIVLFDGDEQSTVRYASAFGNAGLRLFTVVRAPVRPLLFEEGFDAMYCPLAGAERWNVRPIDDVIQVVKTDDTDQAEGWPRFVLAGLSLSLPNAVDVAAGFRTWATALLAALREPAGCSIARVKVSSDFVRLSDLTPNQAAEILRNAEDEYFTNMDSADQ
jgi:hypothetical protein